MAVQRAHRHALTSAELTPAHPARPIQTCQPLDLSSATTTNHCSKLSAHKQSSSQILSSKKGAFLRRVPSNSGEAQLPSSVLTVKDWPYFAPMTFWRGTA